MTYETKVYDDVKWVHITSQTKPVEPPKKPEPKGKKKGA